MTEFRLDDFRDVVTSYARTCTACPTQYQGTLWDGRRFYFRYRHGHATLGIGATDEAAVKDPGTVGAQIVGALDGFLDEDEFRDLFMRLFADRTLGADRG